MLSPAFLSSRLTRQILFVFALVALIVSAGCNNASESNGPAFSVASTHTGNFAIGQQGATYTETVTNSGHTATNGTMVTATDTVPSGMTLVSMAGTGWTCAGNSCTRTDVLAAGASYPTITVTVNVSATATSPETNQVSASGGGTPATAATGSDATVINTPVLTIASAHAASFVQGQLGATYTVTVSNTAGANIVSTIGTVTATDTLPSGMTMVSMAGTGWTCTTLPTCTRADALAAGASYPAITVTVNVNANATTPESNAVSVSGGGSPAANGTDSTIILTAPTLSISKSHVGNFSQAQLGATYSVTVSNATGAAATNGTVTVTETAPAGLTLAAMSGTGWTCTTLPVCTRADALAGGASYPAITVTVNVLANATSPQINAVSVSGGGSAGANTTNSTIILAPALGITKSHTGNFALGQQNATYTVTVSNGANAGTTSGTVTVTESVPAGETLVSMAGTGWTCTVLPTCTRADALAGGASYPAITVTVNVAANATTPQVNGVSVAGGNSASANTTDSTIILEPALSITKSHTGNFTVGQNGVFTIAVGNTGAAATTGTITVTDTLAAGFTFVSGTGTNWTCGAVAQVVTCTNPGPIAAAGAAGNITLTVGVALNAPASIANTAVASTTNSANASSTDTVTVVSPDLAITKSHSGSFTAGTNGNFTIAVSNMGTAPTSGTITVTDALNANLTFVSGTGTNWVCGAAGQLVTCTNAGPIANGAAAGNIALTVAVNPSTASGNITNIATVATSGDNNAGNNSSTDIVSVNASPDLAIVKTATSNFTAGSNATFGLAVSNVSTGPTIGTITVTDTLNASFSFVSGTGTGWTCGAAGQLVTCTNPGPIAGGASAANIVLTVAVNAGATGSVSNTATVQTTDDNNAANNSSTISVPITFAPDLAITKTVVGSFTGGTNGTFQIAVKNNGVSNTTGTITVTDTLNANFSFVSGTGTGWTCGAVGQLVTCTNPGPIAAGASAANIILTVGISASASGNISNTATVADPGDTTDVADKTSTISASVNAAPDLAIVKTATSNFVAGQNATFGLAVSNVSSGPTIGGITVTDTLNANFTFVSGTGTGWTCGAVAQLVTCTNPGPIAGGASAANIVLTVAVNAAASGSISNTAAVQTTDDNNAANNSSTISVTVTAAAPDLAITKTAVGTFTAGSSGAFQFAVHNGGTAATTGTITVTDTLNSAFTYVGGTGTGWTCGAVGQVVTCTNTTAIASGSSAANITLAVSISSSASGSISNTATVSDPGDTTDVGDKTSTISVNVGSGTTASVQITSPQTAPIPLGTGGIVNFIATITNGAGGVGVNWTVNGVTGGNGTVGTITPSSTTGATQQAMYTAPASVPGTGGTITITATYAGTGSASASATINLVANVNSNLPAMQYAFQTRGFTAAGLPFGMVGTFTSNGTGGLSNVLIDTVNVNAGGNSGSTATSKIAWNGTYAMDTANHGLIHMTLASNASVQMNFGFVVNAGNGSLVELDTPLGSTAFGSFSSANSSNFVLGPGGVNGPFVLRLDGPGAIGSGNNSSAVLGQLTVAQTGSSTTAGTITGSFTDNQGNAVSTVVPSTITMDADGSGHGTVSITLSGGNGTPTLSFYVSDSSKIYLLETDSNNEVQTGILRAQTIPSGGFTTANSLSSAMLFEAIGVNGTTTHASVIVGGFSPNGSGVITAGEYDASDGGTIPAGSPVALTGTYAITGPAPGQGTLTFTSGGTIVANFVFYMRKAGDALILEQPNGGVTEKRVGQMATQTEPVGGFTNATFSGITITGGTQTDTGASGNGVAVVQYTSSGANGTADFSALSVGSGIGGTATITSTVTDSVRGRRILTASAGSSIFGAATAIAYSIDSTGASIIISIDPTLLEPQIIILGN